MKDMWDYLYQVVMTCNDYLEIVGKYKSAHSSDADALDAYTAELRAVRAMYYFYLMDLFGNIPLVTSTDIKTTDIRQNKRSELFWFTVKLRTDHAAGGFLPSCQARSECRSVHPRQLDDHSKTFRL